MYTFKKEERLRSKKQIDELFLGGDTFFCSAFRVIWREVEEEQAFPARVMIAVPKQNFKRAAKRNFIRRRIKEAYRIHKHTLYAGLEKAHKKINFIMIYSRKDILDFKEITLNIVCVTKSILKKVAVK